jgi:hypothetical protein
MNAHAGVVMGRGKCSLQSRICEETCLLQSGRYTMDDD